MSTKDAKVHLVFLIALLLSSLSCKKEGVDIVVDQLHPEKLAVPRNFPEAADDADNPLSKEGIELGRLLFYDTRLSGNNQLSCASCHRQDIAFSDAAGLSNIGISGNILPRHSPALINLAWAANGLFWDGGSTNLESQAFGPLTSADEMGQNLAELEFELKQVPEYQKRFKLVFGSEINSAAVVKALAQFERTLISGNSKYDQYVRKGDGGDFTDLEKEGLSLVNSKCRNCHAGELFTDNQFHNNGIDNDFKNNSLEGLYQGRYRISYNLDDLGKFKTPTLRNVLLTAPYMHDGRFSKIEDVLEHYNSGVKVSVTTDHLLLPAAAKPGIALTAKDKSAILAFLATLTDYTFIQNKKLSNPYHD
jgi:cytochrome c peroxidase